MKYVKPALSFEQQADLLLSRGLHADRATLIVRLSEVNYYRLSAYWYSFRQPGTEDLQTDATLDTVWNRYVFDRQLRVLIMDAIERVEVSVKTRLANVIALQHGPFGYLDRRNLPGISVDQHRLLLDKIHKEMSHSKESFIAHYLSKYTSETELPIWMAVEIMDFGAMLTLFRATDQYTNYYFKHCERSCEQHGFEPALAQVSRVLNGFGQNRFDFSRKSLIYRVGFGL